MWKNIAAFCRREAVLCAAAALAALSSCLHTPSLEYIDFGVLSVLWSLMLVVAGLKSVRFLDWQAVELLNRCRSWRSVTAALVGITYVASMFVTNDVALLTFVPLALVIGKTLQTDMARVIILQTLAANLGSMLTPPGNPQNLFLYSYYGYAAQDFLGLMLWPGAFALAYLCFLLLRRSDSLLQLRLPFPKRPARWRTALFLALMALNILAVLHVLDKTTVLLITGALTALADCKLFKQVDYSLLATFAGFFIFIGNISHTEAASYLQQSFLGTAEGTYLAALISSQFISNVPAAMLLAGLTREADALLLGVNIGGLGTLIASMASVISYKLFAAEHPYQAGTYLRMFLYYNFAGLLLLGTLTYIFLL